MISTDSTITGGLAGNDAAERSALRVRFGLDVSDETSTDPVRNPPQKDTLLIQYARSLFTYDTKPKRSYIPLRQDTRIIV